MTQLHHSKIVKYRPTRTHAANIQTLHAHKRSVQHPITAAARMVWSSTSARIIQGLAQIGLNHTASRAGAKAITSRHVGVRQQWSAVLSRFTACAQCWLVSVSFCLLSKRVSFCWLARDRLFILAGRRVPVFACWASHFFFFFVASKRLCLFSWSQASVIFCLPEANLFDSHLFTRSGCLVLLYCLLHARPLSGTHSCSLSFELSRAYTLACAHLLAGECLFLLAAQASASFCWLDRDRLFILADRLVSVFKWRASDCLFLPVADKRLYFFWCQASVFFYACRQMNLLDSHVLSPTPLPPFRPLRTLWLCAEGKTTVI